MTAIETDRQQILEVIERYRRGFARLDPGGLKAIWDQDYDNLIYVAQELARPMRGWDAIERYYERLSGILGEVETMKVSEVTVDVLGDMAYAFCTFHFEGKALGEHHVATGQDTFILHRKDGVWKVIHYHESAPGLLQ